MSWIAKNSITGFTYGKSFDSIYDCQLFIDKELMFLEYEMRRAFSVERDVIEHLKHIDKPFLISILDEFADIITHTGDEIASFLKPSYQLSVGAIKQEEYDNELYRLACLEWQKNNIIRCWNIDQERFATGFDF